MKNKQFTCAVSMAIPSEEQFNNDLRQPLIDLGYEYGHNFNVYNMSFSVQPMLVTNFNGVNGVLNNMYLDKKDVRRHFIDTYNPKLFLALASLTTESTETKEEVLARFENKIEERELIGYRFKSVALNKLYMGGCYNETGQFYSLLEVHTKAITKLTELNLLDTFCKPVYKEIKTISIEEAETILRSIGRTEKIKA